MPVELEAWMAHFAVALARIAAAMTFVPLPGLREATTVPRVVLSICLALILAPALAVQTNDPIPTLAAAAWRLPQEAALGLGAGVIVGWIMEVFTFGMQLISVPAGFSYASTIDPATQADSGVLQVAGQLAAGLLFVSLGWEREILRAFALSFERTAPGAGALGPELATMAIRWSGAALTLGFRLAMPVTAFLLLLDVTLALLGRTQPQMPLINLALPVKMGATLLLLAWQAAALPALLARAMEGALEQLAHFGISR